MNKRTIIYIGIGLGIVALGIGVYFLLRKKKRNPKHGRPDREGEGSGNSNTTLLLDDPETYTDAALSNPREWRKWIKKIYLDKVYSFGANIKDPLFKKKWKPSVTSMWQLHLARVNEQKDSPEPYEAWVGGWVIGDYDTPEQSVLMGRLYEATRNNGYGFITQSIARELIRNAGISEEPNWLDRLPVSFEPSPPS